MDDNGSGNMLLNVVAMPILIACIGIAGYWVKRRIDFSNKKKDVSFEDRRKAAKEILSIISGYVGSSERLCEKSASGAELTLDACIHACKENVRELVRLRGELSEASGQFIQYLDKGTKKKAEKMNSLIFSHLNSLTNTFEAADESMEDGGEVLRIMKCGISAYHDKFTREISPVMTEVKDGFQKGLE